MDDAAILGRKDHILFAWLDGELAFPDSLLALGKNLMDLREKKRLVFASSVRVRLPTSLRGLTGTPLSSRHVAPLVAQSPTSRYQTAQFDLGQRFQLSWPSRLNQFEFCRRAKRLGGL